MFDFTVFDQDGNERNLERLIGQDTAVLCHAVYPSGELPYYHYLTGLGCRIVMIHSNESPLLHMTSMAHDLAMETYTDPRLSVVSELNDMWSMQEKTTQLAKKLRFQILMHKGDIVSHWKQPLHNRWEDFMSDKKFFKHFYNQFGVYGIRWLQKHNNNIGWLWDTEVPLWEYIEMGNPNFDVFFKHYRLMPNEDLEQEIKAIKG
jgi:hypothetical protein